MMALRSALAPALAMVLAACATSATKEGPYREPAAASDHACDASGLQGHIGHKASQESGTILLELSGARVLRWLPPRTAVTMEYRADRLTISYDDDMAITRIGCG